MHSTRIFHYNALTGAFTGEDIPEVRDALVALFKNRHAKAEAKAREAADALARVEQGSSCSTLAPSCMGEPNAGPSGFLPLTRYDGASTFIDATGVFRVRVVTAMKDVEEVDRTSPAEVAHLEPLVRGI